MTKFENELTFGESKFYYCDLKKVFYEYPKLKKLPNVLKILLEINLRKNKNSDPQAIIDAFLNRNHNFEISFSPTRILMQDLTGIPVLVEYELARKFLKSLNNNEKDLSPTIIIDLIIDHSMITQSIGTKYSFNSNIKSEIDENKERYKFLKWANETFETLSVIPPGFGIGHQINLEFLSTMISVQEHDDKPYIIPEVLIGTDLHTSMINSLGILAWSVGELDCLTVMFGSSIDLKIPKVLGIKIVGKKDDFINFSDVVINLISFIKEKSLNYDYIEFFGEAIKDINVENRAVISNMANEIGVKCAYFSVDDETINYASKTRNVDAILIKEYYEKQDLYFNEESEFDYDEVLEFDLSLVKASITGPKNPYKKVPLHRVASKLESFKRGNILRDNDIVLASITSCLSTSNPYLIIQAALLAKNALEVGLSINPNIKTSFTAGSVTVKSYLEKLGLLEYLEKLGFGIIGYGCGVCAGNSGNLFPNVESEIKQYNLNVSSVSSGNQNYEGYIHSLIKSNWLMSPALVIAYSLRGSVNFNIEIDAISKDIYLKDIWPKDEQVKEYVSLINYEFFPRKYNNIFIGDSHWMEIETQKNNSYIWNENSTYINPQNYLDDRYLNKINLNNAQILMILGDNISCDEIMPSNKILADSAAGEYLNTLNIHEDRFASYEIRKTNNEILRKSVFSTKYIKNKMVKKEGAFTKDFLVDETVTLDEYCKKYENTPLVIFAGKEFGAGKNIDTTAKALRILGVDSIIAESIDKDFRIALIKFGILPLELESETLESLDLMGSEKVNIFSQNIIPNEKIQIEIIQNNQVKKALVKSLLIAEKEIVYFKNGGIVSYLIKKMVQL